MKKQIKLGILAVAFTALMTGLVLPSLAAAGVIVGVGAVQREDSSIVVTVIAISSTRVTDQDLDKWELESLTVDGLLITEPAIEHSSAKLRTKLWVVRISDAAFLANNDIVSAVVDVNGEDKPDNATCKLAPSWLGDIFATCK